ncbi:MAG: class I SAM-dependent methyltransferase [Candidatus Omnitrophota bacterium]
MDRKLERENLYEDINCPLCGLRKEKEIYSAVQFINDDVKKAVVTDVICLNCGFMYMNPRFKESVFSEHYIKYSSGAVYHECHENSRHGKLSKERKAFIEHHLKEMFPGAYLDVGCGQGDLLRALNLVNWKKDGVEPLWSAREIGVSEFTVFPVTLERFVPREKYRAISCISVLEHLIEPRACLKKMGDLLDDEGILFIEIPDSLTPKAQIAEFFYFEHISHFTKRTLEIMLNQCGFAAIEFDANLSVPNLRCVARKEKRLVDADYSKNRDELEIPVASYKNEREVLIGGIRCRIEKKLEEIRKDGKKVAVYGAGAHTHLLLDIIDMADIVECVIDSDPAKAFTKFRDWLVVPPQEIPRIESKAILISSHDYQEEIAETIAKFNKNNIAVVRCYERLG